AVRDHASTARALARAALAAGHRKPPHGLGVGDRAVSRRIAALQAAPPPRLWPLAVAVPALGALTAPGAADATGDPLRWLKPVLA
ncbi:M56 family peptidase, partial [Streptomyces eurythermus]